MFAQLVQAFSLMAEGRLSLRALTLTPGQIVMGEVVKRLNDQEVIVRIADRTVRARTDIPLANHKHWFQVLPDSHQLVLKVVTDGRPSRDGLPPQQAIPPTAQALLKNWGLKVNKQHVRAVEWLMQQQLPLTRQTVEQLAAVWRNFGQTSHVEQASAFALSKRLPLTVPVVTAVHRFLSGSPITSQAAQLTRQLLMWQSETKLTNLQLRMVVDTVLKQTEHVQYYRHSMLQAVQERANATHNAVTNDPHSTGKAAEVATKSSMLQHASSRLNQASMSLQSVPAHPASTRHAEAQSLQKQQTTSPIHSVIPKWLRLLGVGREEQLTHMLRPANAITNSVTHAANDPIVNLKESVMRLLQFPLPANVRETAEAILQHITGQQLLLTTSTETNWQHLLFHIPFSVTANEEAAIHVFTRKKADGQLDKDNCRLLLQLDLKQLGWSCLLVQIVNRFVHIDWYCDEEVLTDRLATYEPKLREQLQAIGYNLSGVVAKPLKQQKDDLDRHMWPIARGVSSKGVDVRI